MRVQVGSAHVVAVPLRSDPSLLNSLVAVTWRQHCCGRGAIRAHWCVLVYDAAERPARTGVLRGRPGNKTEDNEVKEILKSGFHLE